MLRIILIIFITSFCRSIGYSQVQYLKEDFYNQKVIGSGQLLHPTSIRFDDKGRGYITLKRGVVRMMDTTGVLLATPFLDISEEVVGDSDHGLVSIALDPNFSANGYVYLLYSVDRHHLLHYGTPAYDPTVTIEKQATIGRITRYQADAAKDFQVAIPDSRKVILGKDIADLSFPILMSSHGLGTLQFGQDGTLLASCGDAGSFQAADLGSSEHTYYQQALEDGILREKDNVGSFRSQMVDNLAGKIIRIDRETGEGIPSNPYFDASQPNAPKSRVWSIGFRNPFRFILAPESGSHNPMAGQPGKLFVGDVGSGRWEEVSVVERGGQNFGWPLFEGFGGGWEFWPHQIPNYDAPNPVLGSLTSCDKPFFSFQDLFKEERQDQQYTFINPCDTTQLIPTEIPTHIHTRPIIAWSNVLWNQPTRAEMSVFDTLGRARAGSMADRGVVAEEFDGFSSMPGLFYTEGDFPEEMHNSLFVSDFSGWIKIFYLDERNELIAINDFMDRDTGLVDMALNHKDGCIYYIHYNSHSVNKICFGGTPPPIAAIQIDQQFGTSPLEVHFSSSASYDPSNQTLTSYWDFGEGTFSEERDPIHVFETTDGQPAIFEVSLTVKNEAGLMAKEQEIISLNNTPPKVKISSLSNGGFYAATDISYLQLAALVEDAEHEEGDLRYTWQTFFHHNTHFHEEPQSSERSPFVIIEPTDCGTNEVFWYRFRLTVTDKHGLSTSDEIEIFPFCDPAFFVLKELQANGSATSIILDWEVAQEQEVSHYEIQRTKDFRFQTIGTVPANGRSTYLFEDKNPVDGKNYYRIMGVRTDGAYEFSKQVSLRFPAEPEVISIYPNPTRAGITINTKYPLEEVVYFELYDPLGKLLYTTEWATERSEPIEHRINLTPFINGVYLYKVLNGSSVKEGKLLILR